MDSTSTAGDIPLGTETRVPEGYRPPASEAELTRRYDQGERYFRGATLRDANLAGCDLRGADLSSVDFGSAHVRGTNLRDTALRDADLTRVTGLFPAQLAGADVCGADLPRDIGRFQALDAIKDLGEICRTMFLGLIAAGCYVMLTLATTSDQSLLFGSGNQRLPILDVNMPLVTFLRAAPVILLGTYAYFLLYMQRYWDRLADQPAVLPDGRSLDEAAYPWLMTGLVRGALVRLRSAQPPFWRLEAMLAVTLGWCFVPFVLFRVWARGAGIGDGGLGWLHAVLVALAVAFSVLSYATMQKTLRHAPPFGGRATPVLFVAAVALGAVGLNQLGRAARGTQPSFLSALTGLHSSLELSKMTVSQKPDGWSEKDDPDLLRIAGASLPGRDLRGLRAESSFLVRARLENSLLEGALLRDADLRFANLVQADLRRADLTSANLAGADLTGARLDDSTLRTTLSGAKLDRASFLNADLEGAVLSGTTLRDAKFDLATLRSARLDGIAWSSVRLSQTKLANASLLRANLRQCDLLGADLRGAVLLSAVFIDVKLVNAHLDGADLRNAELTNVDLSGARFEDAQLQGIKLRGVRLANVRLTGARGVDQLDLSGACGDDRTELPPSAPELSRCDDRAR